jgi:ribosomal protein S8
MKNAFKRSKFNAIKTNGYDSRKEAKRAEILKLLQRQGLISDLQEQVVYELIPKQTEIVEVQLKKSVKQKEICIERACTYIADFTYTENGVKVVEDCKGMRLPDYKIKRKLMLFIHGIKIKET